MFSRRFSLRLSVRGMHGPPRQRGREMTLRSSMIAALAAVVLTLAVSGAAATAGGPVHHGKRESRNQLVGTWTATVVRPAPLPALQTLQVFTSHGVAIVVDNESPATHTTQYGVWERIAG